MNETGILCMKMNCRPSLSQSVAWLAGGSAGSQSAHGGEKPILLSEGHVSHCLPALYTQQDIKTTIKFVSIKVCPYINMSIPCEWAGFSNLTWWGLWPAGDINEHVIHRIPQSATRLSLYSPSCLLWTSCWGLELHPLSVKSTDSFMLYFSARWEE